MKLVVDTNIILAALLKNKTIRKIILFSNHKLFVPDFSFEEINYIKRSLYRRIGIKEEELIKILNILEKRFIIVPVHLYTHKMKEAKNLLKDKDDAPFLALALAFSLDAIWTADKGFLEQDKIKIIQTKDILKL